ncbi:hypothetical protein [Pontibacter liquoris]|nr:hypothetical protein [Pontibacter liquoris]
MFMIIQRFIAAIKQVSIKFEQDHIRLHHFLLQSLQVILGYPAQLLF